MTPDRIPVSRDDLDLLLFAAVRYAIGRRSYMAGDTIDMVRRYGCYLPAVRCAELAAVITREIAIMGGDLYHVDEWIALAGWLRS